MGGAVLSQVIPGGAIFSLVIPDGPQGRAGIQTGIPQVPLDPRLRGDDSKKAMPFQTRHADLFDLIPGGAVFSIGFGRCGLLPGHPGRCSLVTGHPGRRAAPSRDPDGSHSCAMTYTCR